MILRFASASLFCFLALAALGKAGAADQPVLGVRGKLIIEDDFSRAELTPKFRPGKGFWSIKEGILTVAENPADKHGAYGFVSPNVEYKDVIAEFSFKLDGSRSCDLRMDDSHCKDSHSGHIFRASISPASVLLGDSRFGSMQNDIYARLNDPTTTPEEKKKVQASIKDKSASFKISLDVSQWHLARVEVVGDEAVISIDGKVAGYLKSPGVDHPTKNMIGFTIGGQSTEIDNLKVWAATAAPDWAARRAQVVQSLAKP